MHGAAAKISSAAQDLMRNYPQFRYLPEGFGLVFGVTKPVDGFGRRSDPSELKLAATRLDKTRVFFHPLMLFVTPQSGENAFYGTRRQPGVETNLTMRDGTTVRATYHDGMWVYRPDGSTEWSVDAFHTVLFEYHGYRIAVRGSRRSGIDRNELLRVAANVA